MLKAAPFLCFLIGFNIRILSPRLFGIFKAYRNNSVSFFICKCNSRQKKCVSRRVDKNTELLSDNINDVLGSKEVVNVSRNEDRNMR